MFEYIIKLRKTAGDTISPVVMLDDLQHQFEEIVIDSSRFELVAIEDRITGIRIAP